MGFEGLFGVIGTLGIMAPIAYYLPGKEGEGIHENIVDTVTVSDTKCSHLFSGLHDIIISSWCLDVAHLIEVVLESLKRSHQKHPCIPFHASTDDRQLPGAAGQFELQQCCIGPGLACRL